MGNLGVPDRQLRMIAALLYYSQGSCYQASVDSGKGDFVVTYKTTKGVPSKAIPSHVEMDVIVRKDGSTMFLVNSEITNHGVVYPYEDDVPTSILEAMDELGV